MEDFETVPFETFYAGLSSRTLRTFKACHVLRTPAEYVLCDWNLRAATLDELFSKATRMWLTYPRDKVLPSASESEWRAFYAGSPIDLRWAPISTPYHMRLIRIIRGSK